MKLIAAAGSVISTEHGGYLKSISPNLELSISQTEPQLSKASVFNWVLSGNSCTRTKS